ncbi:hypothetical protein AB0903_33540 [Streptomyces sp. NPDC048389]|uniref:hypothetical protein n=1 Tax=Streptomyces sp. NPDC048389 TaxID=3154622 RepID=UPI00345585DF
MTDTTDDHTASIRSTLDDHGNAACLLAWGPVQALLAPDTVLITARDLMAAASFAETDVALIRVFRTELQLDMATIGHMVRDIRAERPTPTGKAALRISAIAGANTGLPYVHIARGSMKGELTPDEARQMAVHWTEAAVAAQIDVRLRYALGEWDRLDITEIDHLFALIQKAAPQ